MEPKYIEKQAAIDACCFNCSESNICSGTCDDTDRIKNIPPADVRSASAINDAVDDAIRILNDINTSGRLYYGDYCELYDAICSIWIRGSYNGSNMGGGDAE